ncbi:prolipoprotein diacylglyceryl transferase [Falsarthrobacter nasiphocae]|uniref:Phosphatidylglycerol--prolipoprotein diacylglyceryl transferase n=1 Tax=Falsarthrobacter nasiphocae TaxID=189863 RepID=A0AAE3YD61_9MICC|nr:prolipoprotein diacylglyceryl transferase [Falsarthrobacter nasiphocae]MDR6891224.1 prolipoprotein diacylglyceryl transferase [Falsarthrobacter nasiphocae]
MLASIPSPSVNGFDIGPLRIHFYALCIIAGIVVALWITARRLNRRGVATEAVLDVGLWCVPFGIAGGRIYHVLSHWPDYFGPGKDPLTALYIWEGGLAIMGAITLGALGAYLGCRRAGIRLTAFMDAAAPGLLVAQAMGRWGNWFNQELFGGPTTLPWGLEISPSNPAFPAGLPADTLFHPTFLYEMIWNLTAAAVIVLLDRRMRFRLGSAFWLYVMLYNAGRYVLEHVRRDPAVELTLFGVTDRINSWAALLLFALGLVMFVATRRRHRRLAAAAGTREASVPASRAGSAPAPLSGDDDVDSPFSDIERAREADVVLETVPAAPSAGPDPHGDEPASSRGTGSARRGR